MLNAMIAIITAFVSGGFLLAGYVFQKRAEHARALAEKRRDVYSSFLKATFEGIAGRLRKTDLDQTEEVYWKSQICLYGSDSVLREFGGLMKCLPRPNDTGPIPKGSEIAQAFDRLIIEMRRDVLSNTRATLDDIRATSPIFL